MKKMILWQLLATIILASAPIPSEVITVFVDEEYNS
jgi:hypothetical protein